MKKIIFFILLTVVNLYSQDFEPQQAEFDINGNANYLISSDSLLFQQNKMLLGWHWGGAPFLEKP